MTRSAKKGQLNRGKGILSVSGPQSRFILFLIFILVAYTLLLRIFQKIAAIVELPVFLPIALVTLLAFIGIAGTLYSHRFVGPMVRIRRTLEQVARGDCSVTLRLRDSDDPMLKDLVTTIGSLCDQSRHTNRSIHDAAQGLFNDLTALRESIVKGAPTDNLVQQLDRVLQKQSALEKAVRMLGT